MTTTLQSNSHFPCHTCETRHLNFCYLVYPHVHDRIKTVAVENHECTEHKSDTISPSIFCCVFAVGSWWQQDKGLVMEFYHTEPSGAPSNHE